MAEFALVLPLILVLLLAVVQFGVAFNHYLTITDATRAGARKAAVSRHDPNRVAATQQAVRASAQNLNQGQLAVPAPVSSWQSGSDVTVSASYPYSLRILGVVVKSGMLTSTTTERVE